mgnify:CR=1 FL=1
MYYPESFDFLVRSVNLAEAIASAPSSLCIHLPSPLQACGGGFLQRHEENRFFAKTIVLKETGTADPWALRSIDTPARRGKLLSTTQKWCLYR